MIKQVRKISQSKIEIAAAAAENVWNLTLFQLDAGLYNIQLRSKMPTGFV